MVVTFATLCLLIYKKETTMPSTTFLSHKPSKHPNEEIQELVDEVNSYYKEPRWFADFYVAQESSFLSSKITSSRLYYNLGDNEYQCITCAKCEDTIKAYLLGTLNFITKTC